MIGDPFKGEGIEPAVDGVAAIVHCASSHTGDPEPRAGGIIGAEAPHLVYISIVGGALSATCWSPGPQVTWTGIQGLDRLDRRDQRHHHAGGRRGRS